MVMTYADVIVKGFAVSVAIICTTICSYILFDSKITFEFILGAIGVLISISNYNDVTASWKYQNPEPLPTEETIETKNENEIQVNFATIPDTNKTLQVISLDDLETPNTENSLILEDLEN